MFITKIPNSKNSESFPIQFVTGYCADVITSRDHSLFKHLGNNDLFLNAIKATLHTSEKIRTNKSLEQTTGEIYIPLMRGMTDVPTRGDVVLLCQFGGINYYLGPVNTINNPNFNYDLTIEHDESDSNSTISELYGISPGFKWDPETVGRLEKLPNKKLDGQGLEDDGTEEFVADNAVGDFMIEGRQGNSIRVGQRGNFPYMVFSNGHRINMSRETLSDNSLISITYSDGKSGTLEDWFYTDDFNRGDYVGVYEPFNLSSNITDNKRQIEFIDEPTDQILLTSDKITFNCKSNEFNISSLSNINLSSADNIKIYTNNSTIIESKNIYLGQESVKNSSGTSGGEPLVMGEQLRVILLDLTKALLSLKTTANSPAISGPPDPGTIATLSAIVGKLSTPQATPFLSTHHFIEKNKIQGK